MEFFHLYGRWSALCLSIKKSKQLGKELQTRFTTTNSSQNIWMTNLQWVVFLSYWYYSDITNTA